MGKEGGCPDMPAKGPTAQWPSRWSLRSWSWGLVSCLRAGAHARQCLAPMGTLGVGLCLLFMCSWVALGAGHLSQAPRTSDHWDGTVSWGFSREWSEAKCGGSGKEGS